MKKSAAIAVFLSVTAVAAAAGFTAYSVMRGEPVPKAINPAEQSARDDSGTRGQWHHTPRLKTPPQTRYFQGRPIPEMREPPPNSASGFRKKPTEPTDVSESTGRPAASAIGRVISEGHRESGPLPVRETIERARRLREKGRTSDAERLIKSAIMTETSPLARQLLQAELKPAAKKAEPGFPDGRSGPAGTK